MLLGVLKQPNLWDVLNHFGCLCSLDCVNVAWKPKHTPVTAEGKGVQRVNDLIHNLYICWYAHSWNYFISILLSQLSMALATTDIPSYQCTTSACVFTANINLYSLVIFDVCPKLKLIHIHYVCKHASGLVTTALLRTHLPYFLVLSHQNKYTFCFET